jgi:large repetitive protein
MKLIVSTLLLFISTYCFAQTTIWMETFDPVPQSGWNNSGSFGINQADANFWTVSDAEGGVSPGGCGVANNGNQTLHITSTFAPNSGALYNATSICPILFCIITNTRAETPAFNTSSNANMTLEFDYIEGGDGTNDDFFLQYSINNGVSWLPLSNPAKTPTALCTPQGEWTSYSIALPASCNNNPNVKIGFCWTNDDNTGTDPSVAINNVKVTVPTSTSNTAPIAVNDTLIINCNSGNTTVFPIANDTDIDAGQTLSMNGFNGSTLQGGGLSNTANSITYNLNPGFTGTTFMTYTVCDDGSPSLCDTGFIVFVVGGCNNAPIANNDTLIVNCNSSNNLINVISNDTDPDALQTISVIGVIASGAQGFISTSGNQILYTPNPNFSGTAIFQYIICDNGSPSLCDTGLIYITVTSFGCNSTPIATNDSIVTPCNQSILINVLANDTDPNSNSLSVNGILTLGIAGTVLPNATPGAYLFTPTNNFSGTTGFAYLVCDNGIPSLCDTGFVIITVGGCNQSPLALVDNYTVCFNTTHTLNVMSNDIDPDGNPLSLNSILIGNSPSLFSNNGTSIIITPTPGYIGNFSFDYIICDNGIPGLCDTATVNVTVVPCNIPPVAVNDAYTVPCVATTTFNVIANDFDPDGNIITSTSIIKNPIGGTAVFVGNQIVFTTPMGNCYSGLDTILYKICDNGNPVGCDTGMVIITINNCGCNQNPNAINDQVSINCNTNLIYYPLVNDNDPNAGQTLTVVGVITTGTSGTATIGTTFINFSPNAGFFGTTTLKYIIADNGIPVLYDTATITITINNVNCNGKPIANIDNYAANCALGTVLVIPPLSNDADPDQGQIINVSSLIGAGTFGTFVLNNDLVTYTLNGCTSGIDSIQYVIKDNGSPQLFDTSWIVISINVNCNCNPPIAVIDFDTLNCNTTKAINPILNDFDPDGAALFLGTALIKNPSFGTIVKNGNVLTYTPNNCFSGNDTVLYKVTDVVAPFLSDTGMIVFTVNANCPCNAPVAV